MNTLVMGSCICICLYQNKSAKFGNGVCCLICVHLAVPAVKSLGTTASTVWIQHSGWCISKVLTELVKQDVDTLQFKNRQI